MEMYGQVRRAVYVEGLSRRGPLGDSGSIRGRCEDAGVLSAAATTGRAGRRRGRSWIRSSGSSIGSWPRIKEQPAKAAASSSKRILRAAAG